MAGPKRHPSSHDALVQLLRSLARSTLLRLASLTTEVTLSEIDRLLERTPSVEVEGVVHSAREGRPDLAYTIHGVEGQVLAGLIIEVQLSRDPGKRWRWSLYQAVFASEIKKPVKLGLLVPNPAVASWVEDRLLPHVNPRPVLIQPDQIELITDLAEARRRPQEAILGAVYHALRERAVEERVAGIGAAIVAARSLAPLEARRYTALIMETAPEALFNQALELLEDQGELDLDDEEEPLSEMELNSYAYQRGLRKGRDEGRDEGWEQGRDEGWEKGRREALRVLRAGIFDMLEVRGLEPSPALRERVQACEDLEALERLLTPGPDDAVGQVFGHAR